MSTRASTGATPVTGAGALLDRELPEEYRREWTAQVAEERRTHTRLTHAVFVFRIGEEWLGLPAPLLTAVVPWRPVRSVPHQRNGVFLGLVTLRGQLFLCASLARLLGIGGADAAAVPPPPRLLIVGARDEQRVVCPVDEVYGVVRYAPDVLQELPPSLAGGARYTTALLPWNGRMVACLDGALVLYAIDRALA